MGFGLKNLSLSLSNTNNFKVLKNWFLSKYIEKLQKSEFE